MSVTPLDIHNKEFSKKFRGYDPDEVDGFLDQIIQEFETLIKEKSFLKEQAEELTKQLAHYQNLEETIQKTLVVAQDAAEDVKASAKKQADLIIQEARLQAGRIIEAGQAKATRIMEENADLARAAQTLRTQVKALLVAQLKAIGELQDPFSHAAAAQAEVMASRVELGDEDDDDASPVRKTQPVEDQTDLGIERADGYSTRVEAVTSRFRPEPSVAEKRSLGLVDGSDQVD